MDFADIHQYVSDILLKEKQQAQARWFRLWHKLDSWKFNMFTEFSVTKIKKERQNSKQLAGFYQKLNSNLAHQSSGTGTGYIDTDETHLHIFWYPIVRSSQKHKNI